MGGEVRRYEVREGEKRCLGEKFLLFKVCDEV